MKFMYIEEEWKIGHAIMSGVRTILVICCEVILGSVLVFSSIGHIENSYGFLSSVYSYSIVYRPVGILIAATVPGFELAIGMTLLFNMNGRHCAFIFAGVMFSIFTFAQSIAFSRGLNISCGCFGTNENNPIGPFSIGRTVFFAVLAFTGYYCSLVQSNSNVVPAR